MKPAPRFLAVLIAVAFAGQLRATLGTAFQTQLGNPSNAATTTATPDNYFIARDQFALSYNNTNREANWVSWSFSTTDRGSQPRTDAFAPDPLLPATFNIIDEDGYRSSGFDRGHMCPSADRTLTRADNEATFFMTNMIPQTPDNNQGVWNNFEQFARDQAALGNEVLNLSGPSGFSGATIASGVAIPGYTWKVIVIVPNGPGAAVTRIDATTRVIAIKVPNIAGIRTTPWQNFVTSAAQIEADTGLDLFRALPSAALKNILRAKVDGQPAVAAPVLTAQPLARSVQPGGAATFTVTALGTPAPTYQWRKDGVAIAGATGTSLTFASAQAADAGGYDVVVSNVVGSATSSLARLAVAPTPTAPVFIRQPASAAVPVGRPVAFTVATTAAPDATYQWFKDGLILPTATASTLTLGGIGPSAAGAYSVVATNSAGTVTSAPAILTALRRSVAGAYFGTLGAGEAALFIFDNNTGVFLGFNSASRTALVSRAVAVADDGTFRFAASTVAPPGGSAIDDVVFTGSISDSGAVTGASSAGLPLVATRATSAGPTAALAGFYQAGAAGNSAQTLAIVGSAGQAFVLSQSSAAVDAGTGTVAVNGRLAVTTAAQRSISGSVSAGGGAFIATVTEPGGAATAFTGFGATSDALAAQRLVNLSTRASAGTGEQVAIAGFVITGLESKPVLIRAVGPGLRGFGVPTALTAPRLELLRGSTVLASNTGWSTGGNAAEIAGAAARSGAFPLAPGSADAVILTTLAPGTYTAIVSAANVPAGPALAEIYDLSGDTIAQKLINLSTRAVAGTGDNALIAGLVVGGTAPKRILVRAAGPALSGFGVSGALARPQLVVRDATNTTVAENAGWSASPDAAAIAEAAVRAGAFPFAAASADAAVLIHLSPGNYTAQVTGLGGTTGVALVEVYELP